jgi:MoaA/NifB/PqqE/SkfB family radical SAM enzyme
MIHENGDIVSCICGGWHTYGPMGNILKNSLTDIFSNQHFNNFRNSIVDQSFRYCLKDQCPKLWNLDKVDKLDFVKNFPNLPTTILLAIDRNCNLKCGSCRNSIEWEKLPNFRTKQILNLLVNEYQNFEEPVVFQCDGAGDIFASSAYKEFFNRNDLPKCFQFNLTSNGNLISKNLHIIEKIKSQILSVGISFDAATQEVYKEVRGGRLDIIVEGINAMKDLGIETIHGSFIIQKKNYLEVVECVNLCKSLGLKFINISKIDRWFHMTNEWWDENKLDNNINVDYEQLIFLLNSLKNDKFVTMCGGVLDLMTKHSST